MSNKRIVKMVTGCIILMLSSVFGAGDAGILTDGRVGARAFGMGNAFTSIADDASAVYWNPAGQGLLKDWNFAGMYSNMLRAGLHSNCQSDTREEVAISSFRRDKEGLGS